MVFILQTTFLQYLLYVEKAGSLSIAANNLYVSQPALSSGIKTLEQQLGTKLLHRTNKGVTLTAEGQQVVEKARQLFQLMSDIETMFQEQDDTHFVLDDVIIYANPAYTSELMTALTKEYSQTNFLHALQVFHTTPNTDMNKLLFKSNNTVVLAILPEDYILPSTVTVTLLNQSQTYVMCAKNNPYFLPEQTSTKLKEIHKLPLVTSNTQYEFYSKLLSCLKEYGEPNIKAITPDASSITSAIRYSNYIGFGNKFFSSSMQDQRLRYLPVSDAPIFRLCLLSNKNTSATIIQELVKLLKPLLN